MLTVLKEKDMISGINKWSDQGQEVIRDSQTYPTFAKQDSIEKKLD